MKDRMLRKMGTGGLALIGVLLFAGLAAVAAWSPVVAMGGALLPLVFGMASAEAADTIQNLRTVKHAHNAALTAGDVIVLNGAVLIAVNETAADAANVFIYGGRVIFPKEANLAIDLFDKVYWDSANGVITKTAAGNTECGFCQEKALAADTVVTVMLDPAAA